jgi:hypothetical protein
MMFKILLRPSNILNIFHVTFWLIVVSPRAAFAFATVACHRRLAQAAAAAAGMAAAATAAGAATAA